LAATAPMLAGVRALLPALPKARVLIPQIKEHLTGRSAIAAMHASTMASCSLG